MASAFMRKEAIILQARMASRRLPGKVLAPLAGKTVLEHCVERLQASRLPVIVATTHRAEDDPIEQQACRLGVACTRGEDEDVLARFVRAADHHGLTHVVRATADNPAVDSDSPRRTLAALLRLAADHVVETGLPYGAGVEAFTTDALRRSAALAIEPDDREHVTPLMRRDARFVARTIDAPAPLRRPEIRLTVDTDDDLAFVRRLFAAAVDTPGDPLPLAALIAAADHLAAPVRRGH